MDHSCRACWIQNETFCTEFSQNKTLEKPQSPERFGTFRFIANTRISGPSILVLVFLFPLRTGY